MLMAFPPRNPLETAMSIVLRSLAAAALGVLGTVFAAGVYAETHHAPDQP